MMQAIYLLNWFSRSLLAVFPNLVIYHEFRDFGHGLRDKILLSWQVTSPWFLEIPRKMGKTHYFSQKYQNFSHFFKKIRDFSAFLRFIARDYSDFLGVFLLVIFVTFLPRSWDFQEKSFGNTASLRYWHPFDMWSVADKNNS